MPQPLTLEELSEAIAGLERAYRYWDDQASSADWPSHAEWYAFRRQQKDIIYSAKTKLRDMRKELEAEQKGAKKGGQRASQTERSKT